jgi:hypothetical protein
LLTDISASGIVVRPPGASTVTFKTCPSCGHAWPDLDAFLGDPDLRLVGYQVNFARLAAGFFLFNHSCRTTLALPVEPFLGLRDGPVFRDRKTGTDECPGFCLHRDELGPCPATCECAYVRDVMQDILSHPRPAATA